MPVTLDLNLLPLVRQAGLDQTDLAGLHVAEPPRRAARSRGADHLVLYLTLDGNAPLSPGKQDQILERLAKTYYETPGSVTSALRTVADALNQFLLDRNLRNASSGQQAIGLLALTVFKDDQLYLAQCGPVEAFLITASQVERLYDPQVAGRGLGLSRSTSIRFYHATLQLNDTLLLASQPSASWNVASLSGMHGQGPESMRRRLLNRATSDLSGILLQAKTGKGRVSLLRPKPAVSPATAALDDRQPAEVPAPLPPQPSAVEETPVATARENPPQDQAPQPAVPTLDKSGSLPLEPAETSPSPPADVTTSTPPLAPAPVALTPETKAAAVTAAAVGAMAGAVAGPAPSPVPGRKTTSEKAPPPPTRQKTRRNNFSPGRGLSNAFQRVGRGIKTLLGRMLPGEGVFSIPTSVMAFISIAVPVIVVAVAMMVYIQRGLAAEADALYAQADLTSRQAESQTDPLAKRKAWELTLNYLDQAQAYQVNSQSQALRLKAQSALEKLNLVKRIEYQPAIIGGLTDDTRVTRMIVVSGDLFLLDAVDGQALRAISTASGGYEIDRAFECGLKTTAGAPTPLIDISPAIPGNKDDAIILAMDAKGELISCYLGGTPDVVQLAHPATAVNWGSLVGFTLDLNNGNLVVLDPVDNAVWVYPGGNFTQEPRLYFDESTPPLQDVIDIAVNNEELYLLHADGHLTLATSGIPGVAPTRYVDPARYIDSRPGSEKTPMELSNPFSQILVSQPPAPSFYALEPKSKGIYNFSLHNLDFQQEYAPAGSMPSGSATAFAINPIDKLLFLAVGNQVFYASFQ
jgi:hypothetical protein